MIDKITIIQLGTCLIFIKFYSLKCRFHIRNKPNSQEHFFQLYTIYNTLLVMFSNWSNNSYVCVFGTRCYQLNGFLVCEDRLPALPVAVHQRHRALHVQLCNDQKHIIFVEVGVPSISDLVVGTSQKTIVPLKVKEKFVICSCLSVVPLH